MGIDSDLIRGHIDTIILKILQDGDRYGYEICKEVDDKTAGAYELKQPTLYSCLKRLEDQKLISSYWQDSDIGGKRHYYKLTNKGKATLDKNQEEWLKSRSIIDSLIYTAPQTEQQSQTQEQTNLTDLESVNTTRSENLNEEVPQIENDNPLLIENEDPLLIENEDPLLIENEDPLLIENEDPLQIENEDPLQIEHKEILMIEDLPNVDDQEFSVSSSDYGEKDDIKTFENDEDGNEKNKNDEDFESVEESSQIVKPTKSAYDNFFDDDDDDDYIPPKKEEYASIFADKDEDEELTKEVPFNAFSSASFDDYNKNEQNERELNNKFDDVPFEMEESPNDLFLASNVNVDEDDAHPFNSAIFNLDDDVKTTSFNDYDNTEDKSQEDDSTICNLVEEATTVSYNQDFEDEPLREVASDSLNKDEEKFDVKQYLSSNKNFFNSNTSTKPSIHNFMKKFKEEQELNRIDEAEDYLMNNPQYSEDYTKEKETLQSFAKPAYDTDESSFRYEETEEDPTPTSTYNEINNVDFQDEDDKKFTDEIMLSFSENKSNNEDEYLTSTNEMNNDYFSETEYASVSKENSNNVNEFKQDEEGFKSANRNEFNYEINPIEEAKNSSFEVEKIIPIENPKPQDLNSFKVAMNKIGITVKPYNKTERKVQTTPDYLLINKLKLIRSTISACLVIFLLAFSYIVLDNYNILNNTFNDTYIFYIVAMSATIFVPLIYGLIYMANPFKKQPPKYAFRLSFLFGLLFFMQALVIILAANIMLGFVSFNQVDYNHAQWIVPSIFALWLLISPIVHYYVFSSKKCCV